jgi:hypothetical protein
MIHFFTQFLFHRISDFRVRGDYCYHSTSVHFVQGTFPLILKFGKLWLVGLANQMPECHYPLIVPQIKFKTLIIAGGGVGDL